MISPDHIDGEIQLYIPDFSFTRKNQKDPLFTPTLPEQQETKRREHFRDVHATYSALETRPGAVDALRKGSIQEISYFMSVNPDINEKREYIHSVLGTQEQVDKYGDIIESQYGRVLGYARFYVAQAVLSQSQFQNVFGAQFNDFEVPESTREAAEAFTEALLFEYYSRLDSLIDEEKLVDYERMIGHYLDYGVIDGEEIERNANVIGLNGPVGSGKGTSLELLGAEAVESGTTGIAGRGGKSKAKRDSMQNGHDRYDRWEYVVAGFDRSRKLQRRIPNKLMRLWTAMELGQKRRELDKEGKYDEAIYVSGYPRSSKTGDIEQTKTFAHIKREKMKSVYLEISEEEAVRRTLGRMIDQSVAAAVEVSTLKSQGVENTDPRIAQIEYYRTDDFNSFDFSQSPQLKAAIERFRIQMPLAIVKFNRDGKKSLKEVQDEIRKTIMKFFAEEIAKTRLETGVNGKRARYHMDMDTKTSIINATDEMGIPTLIIYCDGKAPNQVAQEVSDCIS